MNTVFFQTNVFDCPSSSPTRTCLFLSPAPGNAKRQTLMFTSHPSAKSFKRRCDFPLCRHKVSQELISFTSRHHAASSAETRLQRRNKQRPRAALPRLRSDLEYIRIHSRHLALPACHLFNFLLKQTLDSCFFIGSQEGCFPFGATLTCCHRGSVTGAVATWPLLSYSSSFSPTLHLVIFMKLVLSGVREGA